MESKPKILVVDDYSAERGVLVEGLKAMGYDTIEATDGRQALEVYERHGADLVITDVMMPVMNGLNLLKALRERDDELPVIIVTGYDTDETHQALTKYRGSKLILKPYRLKQIQEAIDETLFSDNDA